MYQKHLSPNVKTTLNSPRKVTLVHNKNNNQKYQTKITSTKKVVIEGQYTPLKSNKANNYQQSIQRTKSTYSPYQLPTQQINKLQRVNSQVQFSTSKIVIQTSNKQNNSNIVYRIKQTPSYSNIQKGSTLQRGSNLQKVTSTVRKYNMPNLFITPQDVYEGQYNSKKQFHGHGTYYFRGCNIKYEGQFFDGFIHGFGTLSYQIPNTQYPIIYEGNFVKAIKHGRGKYYYGQRNHYYDGQWMNDLKQGYGRYQSPDQIYQGYWARNKKHGEGVLINKKSDTQFKGKFYDDHFTEGQIKYSNGDFYVGSFHLGKKQGNGTYISKTKNQQYRGQFSNDLRHGKGTLKMSNGDEFTGSFRHGRIDQSMTCSYKWVNGSIFNGWFKNGQLDKGTIRNIQQDHQYQYTSTACFIHY